MKRRIANDAEHSSSSRFPAVTAGRPRYAGSALGNILREWASGTGNIPLRYDEHEETKKAHLDRLHIGKHVVLLRQLATLQNNLAFKESTVMRCWKDVFLIFHAEWNCKAAHEADWVLTMTRRLNTLCATTASAARKTPSPKWLRDLGIWERDEMVGDDAAAEEDNDFEGGQRARRRRNLQERRRNSGQRENGRRPVANWLEFGAAARVAPTCAGSSGTH